MEEIKSTAADNKTYADLKRCAGKLIDLVFKELKCAMEDKNAYAEIAADLNEQLAAAESKHEMISQVREFVVSVQNSLIDSVDDCLESQYINGMIDMCSNVIKYLNRLSQA